ncbi:MAG: DegT/DnrJ/EryC1/StrS family aminotransferase [Candidatus Dormiibacterota bacterium]
MTLTWTPVPISIARPELGPAEEAAVLEVMRSGALAQGTQVKAFEKAFAAATGARFAIATSNGTTALQLALMAHGIGPGDEVITTPLSFIATANAIVHTGGRPVFGDVDSTLNLDPASVEALIGPRTRAIMPVHLHGNPFRIAEFQRIADGHGLALVQDACQAIGATIHGAQLGSFGTAGYSLYATKNLTTGEGGMITTNDPGVAELCASLRSHAYSGDVPYLHTAVGYNFRMTEIEAAIGLCQLDRLEEINRRRRDNAAYLDEAIDQKAFPRPLRNPGHEHVFHQYVITVPRGARLGRDDVRQGLAAAGIGSGVHYGIPIHLQPPYRDLAQGPFPLAESASAEMISLPVHPLVTEPERERIAQTLQSLL